MIRRADPTAGMWYAVAIGLPLAVVALTAGLNLALGASAPSLAGVGSLSTILLVFAVRLVNPGDGALGEEPGWHVPILFLEEGGLQPFLLVGFLLGTVAVTFWYSWLFNHTGGSVLITLLLHAVQGTITIGMLWSTGADLARANLLFGVVAGLVAIGLVVFDRNAWRAPAETTSPPQVIPPSVGQHRRRSAQLFGENKGLTS